MRSLLEKICAVFTGKHFLVGAILFVLFVATVLPWEAARSRVFFADTPTPDTSFIYSAEDLYGMAGDFGEDGRRYYIRSRLTFDAVWPLVYGFFLAAGIVVLGRPIKHDAARYAVFLPFLAVLLDFLENASASLVMFFYPDRIPIILGATPLFTFFKWIVVGLSFLVFLLLGVVFLAYTRRHIGRSK